MMRRNRSPRHRGRVAVLVLLLVGAGAGPWLWTASGGDPHGSRVLVTKVVDGDTIHVGRGWRETTVRLIGVDAPETVHPRKPVQYYGPEASAFTRRSLAGKWVRLEFKPQEQIDNYGRLLAYVFLDDGTLFNRELVRLGYARAYTWFPFRYADDFRAAQAEARRSARGLWAPAAGRSEGVEGKIIGNRRSGIYHLPGQAHYHEVARKNRVYFDNEQEAMAAGYRRAKR